MIKPGICSVTLSKLSVEAIIELALQAELEGIEWWGEDHVPHGNNVTAQRVGYLTKAAGLEVSSYGSYYRVGVSEDEGLNFKSILDTAFNIGAPTIRVWAGNRDTPDVNAAFIKKVVDDTMRIADMSAEKGISITFEYHGGSLTDRNETSVAFAAQVQHPNVYFSWQSPHGYSCDHCLTGLKGLLDRLNTIHVYHWTIGSYENNTVNETVRALKYPEDFFRHPLAEGIDRWEKYFELIKQTGHNHFALLEFVKGDSTQQVFEDSKTLRKLIGK